MGGCLSTGAPAAQEFTSAVVAKGKDGGAQPLDYHHDRSVAQPTSAGGRDTCPAGQHLADSISLNEDPAANVVLCNTPSHGTGSSSPQPQQLRQQRQEEPEIRELVCGGPVRSICVTPVDRALAPAGAGGACCGPAPVGPEDLSTDMTCLEAALQGLPHDIVKYGAPLPHNEEARMRTVRALRAMDLHACPELDLILKTVCDIWNAPSACVTLLDTDNVYICAAYGFDPAKRPWKIAMCPWMLLPATATTMAVPDLEQDARFSLSAHVESGTKSYLTAPLVASNGHRLGAICFTDTKTRKFDAGDCRLMNNCAELAVRALEMHLGASKAFRAQQQRRKQLMDESTAAGLEADDDGAAGASGIGPIGSTQTSVPRLLLASHASALEGGGGAAGAGASGIGPIDSSQTSVPRLLLASHACALEGGGGAAGAGASGIGPIGSTQTSVPRLLLASHASAAGGAGGVQSGSGVVRRVVSSLRLAARPEGNGQPASMQWGATERPAEEEDESMDTLAREYGRCIRDLSEVSEACVLLVDTSVAGWRVVYAGPSFEHLTGADRRASIGKTVNELMSHVNGEARVVWEGVEREAAAGKAFVTPRVFSRAVPTLTFYLAFRPAALDDVDEDTVPIGVPASVPQAASFTTSRFYFARLHTTPDPPNNSRNNAGGAQGTPILSAGKRLSPNIAINPIQGLQELYSGLTVGQVLGQGSFGTVYHGIWHGAQIAIKVQDMRIRTAEERVRAELEVSLGQRLHHVNVVNTLAHASAVLDGAPRSGPAVGSSEAWDAGLPQADGIEYAASASNSGDDAGEGGYIVDSDRPSFVPAFVPFFGGSYGTSAVIGSEDTGAESDPAVAATAAAAAGTAADPAAAAACRKGSSKYAAPAAERGEQRRQVSGALAEEVGALLVAALEAPSRGFSSELPSASIASRVPTAPQSAAVLTSMTLANGMCVPLLRTGTGASGHCFLTRSGTSNTESQLLQAAFASTCSEQGRGTASDGSPGLTAEPSAAAAAASASAAPGGSTAAAAAARAQEDDPQSPFGRPPTSGQASAATTGRCQLVMIDSSLAAATDALALVQTLGSARMPGAPELEAALVVPQDLSASSSPHPSHVRAAASAPTPPAASADDIVLSEAALTAAVPSSGIASPTLSLSDPEHRSRCATAAGAAVRPATSGRPSLDDLSFAGGAAAGGALVGAAAAGMSLPGGLLSTFDTPYACGDPHQAVLPLDGASPFERGPALEQTGSAPPAAHQPVWRTVGAGPPGWVQGAMESVAGPIDVDASGLDYPVEVRLWMVMEFMDRGNLQEAVDRGWLREGRTALHGPDYMAVLATAQDVASAMAFLHDNDVLHGDLSAVNVMLKSTASTAVVAAGHYDSAVGDGGGGGAGDVSGRGFIAKVSDFGLSMQLQPAQDIIKVSAYGALTHMAPEVLRESAISKAADVYSFGVILWQMVTGSRPWAGLSHLQVSVEVGTNLRRLQYPAWVHPGVRALGEACLAPKPEDRPPFQAILKDVKGLMNQVPQYVELRGPGVHTPYSRTAAVQ